MREESGGRLSKNLPNRFRLRRTLYELRLVDNLVKDQEKYGSCDHWSTKKPVIRVDSKLTGRILLDTLIHESAHAWFDDLIKEDAIGEFATDVARLVSKLFPEQVKEMRL